MARRWREAGRATRPTCPYGPSRRPPLAEDARGEQRRRRRRGAVDRARRSTRCSAAPTSAPGFWSLLAGGGERGRRARELIDWAIGPVWEANHVWLIFVLVVLWTGFSTAFASIFSTLFIPLSLAALGHRAARRRASRSTRRRGGAAGRRVAERLFGALVAAHAVLHGHRRRRDRVGRVPVGNAAGDPVTSWLNPLSLLIGALFVATCAYLAAVFLVSDARRAGAAGPRALLHRPRARARRVAAGALAVAGHLRPARRRALRLRRPHERRPCRS